MTEILTSMTMHTVEEIGPYRVTPRQLAIAIAVVRYCIRPAFDESEPTESEIIERIPDVLEGAWDDILDWEKKNMPPMRDEMRAFKAHLAQEEARATADEEQE